MMIVLNNITWLNISFNFDNTIPLFSDFTNSSAGLKCAVTNLDNVLILESLLVTFIIMGLVLACIKLDGKSIVFKPQGFQPAKQKPTILITPSAPTPKPLPGFQSIEQKPKIMSTPALPQLPVIMTKGGISKLWLGWLGGSVTTGGVSWWYHRDHSVIKNLIKDVSSDVLKSPEVKKFSKELSKAHGEAIVNKTIDRLTPDWMSWLTKPITITTTTVTTTTTVANSGSNVTSNAPTTNK